MSHFTPRKIILENPLTVGDETISELTFARPIVAGDMRGIPISGMTFDHMFVVAGRLVGQPPKIMDMIQGDDITKVMDTVGAFLSGGQKTGS